VPDGGSDEGLESRVSDRGVVLGSVQGWGTCKEGIESRVGNREMREKSKVVAAVVTLLTQHHLTSTNDRDHLSSDIPRNQNPYKTHAYK
jgi:hypothetical protein